MSIKPAKVGIVGAGNVGAAITNALVLLSQSVSIVLFDRNLSKADRIGPAIVLTHLASGPDGWLVADRRPELVVAIVTIEPMGPPFGSTPGIGTLEWG